MGYSRKEEIAKLRQQRREAKASKKRKENVREKLVRFLIVCEGTKTEPHYFEALIKNYISTVREVTIEGEGRATVALVDRALEIKQELERKNAMSFDRVWVVFDKDDFDDFNEAIKKAHKLGLHSAWTNEAFELWYYLYFEYLDTGISRAAYIEKLIIRKTKCSRKSKRSVLSRKTKCYFFRNPSHQKKCLRFLWGISFFQRFSDIQVKLHSFVTVKQLFCPFQVILVYMYVPKVQRYRLQRQVYLACH